jgi:FAD:protein FMN transferase
MKETLRRACCGHSALAALGFTLLGLTWCLLVGAPSPAASPPRLVEYHFHQENVLGTSLDLIVLAPRDADAEAAEQTVLDEIERLRQVLSTYDEASEISRLNRSSGPVSCSAELVEVLRDYDLWHQRSGGAFNGQLGKLVRTWKQAETTGAEPAAATLTSIVEQVNRPGWRIEGRLVTRLTEQPLNVNAIGKGYILGKASAAARAKVPSVRGLLVNIGGDLLVWRDDPGGWLVGIADPARHEENAAPLARLRLHDAAVATSAAYERFYTIGGRRYSHIFDPRTGRPAEGVASATVVASHNVTANALATTLCVLSPEEGLKLVGRTPGAECLLVTADGRQLRSPGLKRFEAAGPLSRRAEADNGWPKGNRVSITLTLLTPRTGKKIRRPYVAVWIEDAAGKPIRTLTVWGNSRKYQKDLSYWWKFARDDRDLVRAVSRATRPAGRYQLTWDGTDDKGQPVAQGTYTVVVEVHREYGRHVKQVGKIQCGTEKASVTLDKNAETDDTTVEYGSGGK